MKAAQAAAKREGSLGTLAHDSSSCSIALHLAYMDTKLLVHRGSRFHGTMKGLGMEFYEPLVGFGLQYGLHSQQSYALSLSLSLSCDQEKHLSNEVSFIVLDVVEAFMTGFKEELLAQSSSRGGGSFLDKIFHLLMQLMQTNQTRTFYSHLYATLRYNGIASLSVDVITFHRVTLVIAMEYRSFISQFSERVVNNTEYLAELCLSVLRQCNFENITTRCEASAFLYMLMEVRHRADNVVVVSQQHA